MNSHLSNSFNERNGCYQSLSESQIHKIHQASCEILSRTGMRFHEPEAIELFQKGGADISDNSLVRISPELVEWALSCAPENITIYNQLGEPALEVGGCRSYYGTGSDCMHIYDLISGQRRKAVLEDVINGVRLVENLPHLDFVMSMFLPSDISEDTYERQQMAVMLRESTKPIIFVGIEAASTRYAIEMAAIKAGGLNKLQKQPFIINYVNTVSAFQHNQESVARMLYASDHNIPTIYAPGKHRGMTSPITQAGALALGSAGQLAGLVLSQLKREGSPFIVSNPGQGTLDMRTMLGLYNAPDDGPYGWDLAHHYQLPSFAIAGASDAKVFDTQAAADAALSLFSVTIGGANLIHDIGYLDCAMTGSLELVLLCNEIIGWIKRYLSNLEINDETLALDVIHDVGPDGYFLQAHHTLQHVREDWVPTLFDRYDYAQWEQNGGENLQQRANKIIQKILQSHQPRSLSETIEQQLQDVIKGR